MNEVEIFVNKEVFEAFKDMESTGKLTLYTPNLMILICTLINDPNYNIVLRFYFLLFMYSMLLILTLSLFHSFFRKAHSHGRRYPGIIRLSLASLLIFATMNSIAFSTFFFWFFLPQRINIIYASSHTTNFLAFLFSSVLVVYYLFAFLETVVEFDIMLREPPKKLPLRGMMVVSVLHKDNHYVVSAGKYVIYWVLVFTIIPLCYYLREIIVSAYVDVFVLLGLFIASFIPITLILLRDPLVKSVMETKIVVRPRKEKVDYETWV